MPHPFKDTTSFQQAIDARPGYVQEYLARAARGDRLVCQRCASVAGIVARMGPTTTPHAFGRAIASLNSADTPGAVAVASALSASLVDASASVSDRDFMAAVAERVRLTHGGASVSLSIVWMALKQRGVEGLPDEPPIKCGKQILAEIQRLMLTGDAAVLPRVARLMLRCHHNELRVFRATWGKASAETQVIMTTLQAELIQQVMVAQPNEVPQIVEEFVDEEEQRRAVCCEGPFGMIAMALFAVAVAFASMFALALYAGEMDSIAQASSSSTALTEWQACGLRPPGGLCPSPASHYEGLAARDRQAIAESMEHIAQLPEARLQLLRTSPISQDSAADPVFLIELIGQTADGLAAKDLPYYQRYRVDTVLGSRPPQQAGDGYRFALDGDEGDDE
jgi:hypothetical protein